MRVLIVQALLDGVIGPLLLYAMLRGRPGLIAAALYAVALPIARATAWGLPDALTSVLGLLSIAPFVLLRDWRGAALSGFMLGLAGWFRGDFLSVVPLLGFVIWRAKQP